MFMILEKPNFSLLNHTADLGITVSGTDINSLFEEAAKSLMYIMLSGKPAGKINVLKLSIVGEDLADLMVRWLGEILYLFAGESQVVTHIIIDSISPSHLDATIKTVPFDKDVFNVLHEIKAVTYHQINVSEKDGAWEARIIFDL